MKTAVFNFRKKKLSIRDEMINIIKAKGDSNKFCARDIHIILKTFFNNFLKLIADQ